MSRIQQRACWERLAEQGQRLQGAHLRDLFRENPGRFERFSATLGDLLVDFSKERIDEPAWEALLALARVYDIEHKRSSLFAGEAVNRTEKRPALHMALRGSIGDGVQVDGQPVMPQVTSELNRWLGFAQDVRCGRYRSSDGGRLTDVIHIGVGGSALGISMAIKALRPDHDGPTIHCVSNLDGAQLHEILQQVSPERSLVFVVSKTFTTLETLTNARSARDWLEGALGDKSGQHMVGASAAPEVAADFGINPDLIFRFWNWVGGRYSLWSAVGLSLAIAIGADKFRSLLAGAADVDRHFQSAALEYNLPVVMALIGIWRRNILGCSSVSLIPYDQRLEGFPAYIQQLEMESNSKRVTQSGGEVEQATAPVIWGTPGTNAQHSFFQLLQQGSDIIPVDFIVAAEPRHPLKDHHKLLLANCLAQSRALAFGRDESEVSKRLVDEGLSVSEIAYLTPHKVLPGNRPSTTIAYRRLDAFTLGRLIALHEHKVFVQGAIWRVNPYDQWGVELGKEQARSLVSVLCQGRSTTELDASTGGLIRHLTNLGSH